MNNTYYIIGMVFAGMSLLSAWMFIATKYHYLIKVTGISVVVLATIYCWSTAYSLLGYPVEGYPSDGSVILGFDPEKTKGTIDMWVRDNDTGVARGYIFPYADKLHKAMKEGSEKAQKENGVMKFYRHPKEGEGGEDGQGGQGGKGGKGGKKSGGLKTGRGKQGAPGGGDNFIDDVGAGFEIHIEPNLPEKE